jgi:ABC-type Co2+ transport system permease subunit
MSSFHIHWSFVIITLTILVTGTSLAVVSLYLARWYLRSPAVVFLAIIHLAATAYILANVAFVLVTENFVIVHVD